MSSFGPAPVSAFEFFIIVLAIARITRFIVFDHGPFNAMGRVRDMFGVDKKDMKLGSAAEFFNCPWCISFWIAVLVIAGMIVQPGIVGTVIWPLAMSFAAGSLINISMRR